MEPGLEGRTALVTGASKGIGLGIARALAAEGARHPAPTRSASPASSGGTPTWASCWRRSR